MADGGGHVTDTWEFNRAGFLAWLSTLPRGTVVGLEVCGRPQALGLESRPHQRDAGGANDRFGALGAVVSFWPRLCENARRTLPSKNSTLQIALYWLGSSPGRVKRHPKTE